MRTLFGLCAISFFAAGGASAVTPDPDALDRFDRTGERVQCVDMSSTNITPINDSLLLVKQGPGAYYLNELRGACRNAASNFTRFDLNLFGNRLCAGEILKVIDQNSGMFAGACTVGEFEKLVKKPQAPASN